MAWTTFMDMHSGGGLKEKWHHIYIEAPEDEAKVIFYNRFGHNPKRVSCTCCGQDYSISTGKSLDQCTGYERNCKFENDRYVEEQGKYGSYQTLADYIKEDDVLFIKKEEIKDEEREGDVPDEGYVWVD